MAPTPLPIVTTFGDAIRRRRHWLDLTLVEVGSRAGMAAQHVSEIERGLRAPRLTTIDALARALETTPSELFAPSSATGTRSIGMAKGPIDQRRLLVFVIASALVGHLSEHDIRDLGEACREIADWLREQERDTPAR